ncbi:MAG: hypothetical protein Q8Q46_01285 [Candidatus Giovannonibacteria bacterium]|nr:hypothetical protein [Candidatus Giovannonibacteria bacterium]
MSLFLAQVFIPCLGMHGWTAWSRAHLFIVKANSESQVIEKLTPILPPEDPKVKEALREQDGKEKYFDIKVKELKDLNQKSGVFVIGVCDGQLNEIEIHEKTPLSLSPPPPL